MKIENLFETEYETVQGLRGPTEVMMHPSYKSVAEGINAHEELRGFYSPGDDMIAFWDANSLHEEVIGNDPLFYEYEDVLKLYVNKTVFSVYHFNNPNRTGEIVVDMMGGSEPSCLAKLREFSVFRILMKSRRTTFDED